MLPHKIKYFCCGEYGPRTKRPHYHGIYFGVSVADRPIIEKAWNLGFISISRVTPKRIDYVTGYVLKKFSSKENKKIYAKKHLEMPFQICSQGLGLSYLCDHADELRLNLGDRYKGRNISLPRYYCHKLDIDSDILAAISDYRQQLFLEEHNFIHKTEIDFLTLHSAQRHVCINPDTGLAEYHYNYKYEAPSPDELEIVSSIVYQENSVRRLRDRNKVL